MTRTYGTSEDLAYHQGHTFVMGSFGNGLQIGHIVARVSDSLNEDGLGTVVDGRGDVTGSIAIDKLGGDAKSREENLELVVATAVQVAG